MSSKIKEIQILALSSVEDPDWDYEYRKICRWYSATFSTPLERVETELSVLHVLRHYYEDAFSKLKDSSNEDSRDNYELIKDRIINGIEPEEVIAAKEAEDDEWEKEMLREIEENNKEIEKLEPPKQVNSPELLKNPNIEDELEFSVSGEDSPPEL